VEHLIVTSKRFRRIATLREKRAPIDDVGEGLGIEVKRPRSSSVAHRAASLKLRPGSMVALLPKRLEGRFQP